MNARIKTIICTSITACLAITFLCSIWAQANDSAVETAVGGLVLRKEHGVSMEKEKLFISPRSVVVEYEFLNTTKASLSSEVAFPIPPFNYGYNGTNYNRDFADFKVWINGKPIEIEKEVRAFVHGREVTEDLRRAGITIETFANFNPDNLKAETQITKLKADVREYLVKIGALRAETGTTYYVQEKRTGNLETFYWPQWETHLKYHWKQEFPSGIPVYIRHEYTPVCGYDASRLKVVNEHFVDACFNDKIFSGVNDPVTIKTKKNQEMYPDVGVKWVSYILTTAKTWKTPIRDFQLIVQGEEDDIATLCWYGRHIERISKSQLKIHETNFVPNKELKVYFLKLL